MVGLFLTVAKKQLRADAAQGQEPDHVVRHGPKLADLHAPFQGGVAVRPTTALARVGCGAFGCRAFGALAFVVLLIDARPWVRVVPWSGGDVTPPGRVPATTLMWRADRVLSRDRAVAFVECRPRRESRDHDNYPEIS